MKAGNINFELAKLDSKREINSNYRALKKSHKYNNILLTGASGFLGVYLLKDLLSKDNLNIYCLIRKEKNITIKEKLRRSFEKYGVEFPDHKEDNIILLEANLFEKRLGLSTEVWMSLSTKIDAIYHNGANVHHLYNYETLKSENFESTYELLKLATTEKLKDFHYISTVGTELIDSLKEKDDFNKLDIASNGYLLTKWASEQILLNASKHGFNIKIYRLGNITGNSETGISNYANNHSLLFLKGCIQMGYAPKINYDYEMTPVDILSKYIIRLSIDKNDDHNFTIYNLSNPNKLLWSNYINKINSFGFKIGLLDNVEWVEKLENIDQDNALFILKSWYLERNNYKKHVYKNNVQSKLEKIRIDYNYNYDYLIILYLKYLIDIGFFPYDVNLKIV
jgi:thioester reductase-like protein